MATKKAASTQRLSVSESPFARANNEEVFRRREVLSHVFGKAHRCVTDVVGHPTPNNKSPLDLRLDATEGFIPLWDSGTVIRWRFQEKSLMQFKAPNLAREAVRALLVKGLAEWGDAIPVKFVERDDAWDFEVVVRDNDDCNDTGCVLASAFFPDGGRHELVLYPKMFEQIEKEQIETLAHEFGHIFGLRHFFANVSERGYPSVVFGDENPFTIMNYGAKSEMTSADRRDLKQLYEKAWSGELTHINGTEIRFVRPFSSALNRTNALATHLRSSRLEGRCACMRECDGTLREI
jgi:hypothetical protein